MPGVINYDLCRTIVAEVMSLRGEQGRSERRLQEAKADAWGEGYVAGHWQKPGENPYDGGA